MSEILYLCIEDKVEIERCICIICLGILDSISSNVLSPEETFSYFTKPHTINLLREKGCSVELCNIIGSLTELEDIERIIPNEFESSLKEIRETVLRYIKGLPTAESIGKYWLLDK
jgi:hypothetical protein